MPFWKDIKAKCLSKQKMLDFDHHNLPNVSQNTNFMIDDYHSNLKGLHEGNGRKNTRTMR
jgi:hypothetical protein